MSLLDNKSLWQNTASPSPASPLLSEAEISDLFARIPVQDIESFYQLYTLWSLRKRHDLLSSRIAALQQEIADNLDTLSRLEPSPIALATLAQFQAYDVQDIDLIERMLARGEGWLDHTLQLLERCERLDMIQGNYTQWCEHALEGAYDWLDSMPEFDAESTEQEEVTTSSEASDTSTLPDPTEALLLQKLQTEEDATQGPQTTISTDSPKITQPLPAVSETADEELAAIEQTERAIAINLAESADAEILRAQLAPTVRLNALPSRARSQKASSEQNALLSEQAALELPEDTDSVPDDASALAAPSVSSPSEIVQDPVEETVQPSVDTEAQTTDEITDSGEPSVPATQAESPVVQKAILPEKQASSKTIKKTKRHGFLYRLLMKLLRWR